MLQKIKYALNDPATPISVIVSEIDNMLNRDTIAIMLAEWATLRLRVEDLEKLINTPEIIDFAEGVKIEAAHQTNRWGSRHDEQKSMGDWVAVFTYLLGKFVTAGWDRDLEKSMHHLITIGAVAANAHKRLVKMKFDPPSEADASAKTSPAG